MREKKRRTTLEEEKRINKTVSILFLAIVSALVGLFGSLISGPVGKVIKWGFFIVFAVCIAYLVAKRKVR